MISALASVPSARVHAFRRVLIVALAIGAVLAGLLAMHSMAGASADSPLSMGSAWQINASAEGAADALQPVASSLIANTGLLSWGNDESGALGCALIAMICAVLAIIGGITFFARHPFLLERLKDSGRAAIPYALAARNFAYLPSLTALSISRT